MSWTCCASVRLKRVMKRQSVGSYSSPHPLAMSRRKSNAWRRIQTAGCRKQSLWFSESFVNSEPCAKHYCGSWSMNCKCRRKRHVASFSGDAPPTARFIASSPALFTEELMRMAKPNVWCDTNVGNHVIDLDISHARNGWH